MKQVTIKRQVVKGWWLVLGNLAIGSWASCQVSGTKNLSQPQAIAVVNGDAVTLDEFQRAFTEIKQAGRGFFVNRSRAIQVKRELLEQLIDNLLLYQEAHKKNIVLDPKLVDMSVLYLSQQYPAGGLEEELLKQGKTMERYRKETEQSLLVHKLLQREVVDRIGMSLQESEDYYQKNLNQFQEQEQVRVRQIVTQTEEDAENIRKRILHGESFEELARQYSLGPEAAQGGDLGYFSRGKMPPAIEEACFKLYSPQVSRVVTSPYGFHLFQLVDRKPARQLTFEQAKPEVEKKLMGAKLKEAEAYYMANLRKQADIHRDVTLLERVH